MPTRDSTPAWSADAPFPTALKDGAPWRFFLWTGLDGETNGED